MSEAQLFTLIMQFIGTIAGALAAYVAIKEKLAELKVKTELALKSVDLAHARIDALHALRTIK